MPRTFDIQKTIELNRDKYPDEFKGMTDEQVVEILKPSMAEYDWGMYEDQKPEVKPTNQKEYDAIDDSPGMIQKLALWNPNDALADDYDWAKRSYNNSLAGNVYKYLHGKNKYDVEDIPNTWWQDGLGLVLGMLNPVEAALFVSTAGVGQIAGRTIAKKAFDKSLQAGLKKATTQKMKDKLIAHHLMKEASIEGALSLGTFSASQAAIAGYGNQAVEIADGTRDEFGDWEIAKQAAPAFMSGATLAAIGGGLVKSPMAQKFAIAERKAVNLVKAGEKVPRKLVVEKLLNSPIAQVAAEGQAFTAGQLLEEAILHGEAPSMDSWWRKTFSNTAVIGGMRAGSKVFRVLFTKEPGNDVTRYFKAKQDIYNRTFGQASVKKALRVSTLNRGVKNITEKQQEVDSLYEIKKQYEEAGFETPKEVLNRITEIETESHAAVGQEKIIKGNVKRFQELVEKATDDNNIIDISRLSERERGEFGKLGAETNLWMLDFYETLKSEPDVALEMYKDIIGKKPEGQHAKLIEKIIDSKIDDHLQISDILNDSVKSKYNEQGNKIGKKAEKERLEKEKKELEEADINYDKMSLEELKSEVEKRTGEIDPVNISQLSDKGRQQVRDSLVRELRELDKTEIPKPTEKPVEKPTEKLVEKTQADIEKDKIAELAMLTGKNPDEIRTTKEYQKPDIMSKTGETKLDIESIDRAIKFAKDKKLSESQTKDTQTEKDIIEEVKDTDTFIQGSEKKKYREKTDDKGKPYVVETLNKLINKVKNAGKSISDANKKLINYLIRQPDKIPEELAAGKAQPSTSTVHVGEAISFAKFLKSKNISLLADPKTLKKEIMSYISDLRTKGIDNNLIRQKMSNLRKFYDLYGKLGESKSIEFAPDIASFLGDSKRLGLSGKGPGKYEPTVVGGIEKAIKKVSSFLTGIKESITAGTGKNKVTFSPKELQSLIETFYKTGVRPEDIVNLRLDTSGKKPKLVWVEKKKGEAADVAKAVEISEKDAQVYKQYIIDKTGKFNELDAIFPNLQGKSTKTVNEAVKIAFEKSGEKIQKRTRATGELSDDLKGIQAGRIFRRRKIGELRGDDARKLSEKLQHKGGPESTEKMRYVEPEDIARPVPGKEKKAERKAGEVRFTPKQRKARQEFLDKFKKKWNLSDKQLKESALEKDVLGTFAEGVIKVAKGEWQPSDLFHEQFHKMKEFAKITNNAPLKQLILKATKIAGKTKEYKQWLKEGNNKKRGKTKSENIEEFIGDVVGGKSDRIEFTKGMLPKFNQIMKQIISRIKTTFGVGNFNDYARVLAGKTLKGFKDTGVQYGKKVRQKKLAEKLGLQEEKTRILGKGLRKGMSDIFKELNIFGNEKDSRTSRRAIMDFISNVSGLKDAEGKKISYELKDINPKEMPEHHYQNLKKIEATLKDMNLGKVKRIVDKATWFDKLGEIDRVRISEKNITDAEQIFYLKSMGVKDGNIWLASQKQLNEYAEYVHSARDFVVAEHSMQDRQIAEKYAKDERFTTWWGRANIEKRRAIYPVYKVLEKMGLNKLAKALKSHFSAEAGHLGRGYDMFLEDVTKGHKSKHGDFAGIGERGFNKIKDSLFSVDHKGERLLENIEYLKQNRESLSPAERRKISDAEAFFRKAIRPEFFKEGAIKNKDGSWKGANLKDYINYKTPEGMVVARYVKFMKYYENMLKLMFKKNMNDAEYERFMKQGNVNFVRDGIFLTRQTTKEFKELVDLESKEIRELVKKNTFKIATKLAKEEYKTENPTEKQIGSIPHEKARGKALEELYDANSFSLEKISSKFLLKRGLKLPEFIKDKDGTLIRVYETKFDRTAMTYAIGMSKFLATLEFFPEFANVKGFKKSGAKRLLGELKTKNKAESEWVQDAFLTRIGVGKSNPFETLTGFIGHYANVLAKVGLSSPTTGFKNLITGNVGTMFAYKTQDMARGIADIFRGESRRITKSGKDSISLSHFEEGKFTEFFDRYAFKTGFMKPTERFNRNLAVLASKYDQRRMFNDMDLSKKGDKIYERAYERAKDFYELTSREINLVKKHGFSEENVRKEDFKTTRDFIIEQRDVENALQKMNTMAHVKTQGASADIFMPKWGSRPIIRPMTLYKRMAYAATVNTMENVSRAYNSGNYMKIAMGSLGTYAGGSALLGVFHHLLGQPMPDENDPFWKHISTTLWKGEMLGILSELFSPYNAGVGNSISPAIYENFLVAGTQIWASSGVSTLFGEPRTKFLLGKDQGFDTYLKRTIASYNAYFKFKEKRMNPYNRDDGRFRALYKDFQEDVLETPSASFEGTELSKYKTILRNAFNMGTEEDFLKAYITLKYAIATDAYNKGIAWNDGIKRMKNTTEAEKYAISQLKSLMKDLNPNPSAIRKGMARSTKADRKKFRNWLTGRTLETPRGSDEKKFAGKYPLLGRMSGKELVKRMDDLEIEYKIKLAKIKKIAPYYFRKWKETGELKDMLKGFSYD